MKRRIVFGIIWLALTGFIVFTSLNTGAVYESAGGVVGPWVNQVFFGGRLSPTEVKIMTSAGAKFFGHFCLFALDGLFAYLFVRTQKEKTRVWVFCLFGAGIVLAALGEFIQIFVKGRFPSILDVVINFSGYVSLILPLGLYRRLNSPVASGQSHISPRTDC